MSRVNVGVLRGGPSSEYEVSLSTGAAVIENLYEEKYSVKDIFISRNGTWHARGMPTTPGRALQDVDVVFVALHGEYGEDGQVQKILDAHSVPYTGSGVFGSTLALHKAQTRRHVGSLKDVRMPMYVVLHQEEVGENYAAAVQRVFSRFGPAYIIKPLRGGSSIGISIADSVHELAQALPAALAVTDAVIVEQFIQGREATCGVLESFRDEDFYCLPPTEIIAPRKGGFWDYESKYDDEHELICPGNFTQAEKELMQRAARRVHEALGLNHYSRSDFIVAPSGIYFLEVNTLPGLTSNSLFPKSVDAVGLNFKDFLDHLLTLARRP